MTVANVSVSEGDDVSETVFEGESDSEKEKVFDPEKETVFDGVLVSESE